MIVKVQRNLLSATGDRVLIYNEDRSFQEEWDGTAAYDVIQKMGAGRVKVFFEASHIKGILCLDRKVADRAW